MIKFGESGHPVFRAKSPLSRGTLKSKGLFFAQSFLLTSSVFTEKSQICVKNAKLAMLEQGDLFGQDNLTHCLCQVWWRHTDFWPMILRKKKIYCKSTKNEWRGSHNKSEWSKFCTDAGFLTTVEVGQYFMTKDTEKSHNLQNQWHVVRDPKGWIRGNTIIGPVLEVTTSYLQGKYGVKLELSL